MVKVSVIIPIYNTSAYIERCAKSLLDQTLDDVELIFIDDNTTDNSIEILKKVVNNSNGFKGKITILSHEENRGLPAARNSGLQVAKGECVFHCDSDDFLEPTMLEELYKATKEKDADYVWSDWYLSYETKERYMKMPSFLTADEAMKAMLAGGMKYNVWNKLVKRSLYTENNITFPSGHSMGEDMTMIKLAACARKVAYVPKALYHYVRTNGEAMTQSISDQKIVDIQYNVSSTCDFLLKMKGDKVEKWIGLFKLQAKYPFLFSDNSKELKYWSELYPEANRFIGENPYDSWRAKILQLLAILKQYWFIKIYYCIVYKTVYPKLYK